MHFTQRRTVVVVVLASLLLPLLGGTADSADSLEICLVRSATEAELPTKCSAHHLLFEAGVGFTPRALPGAGRAPVAFHFGSEVSAGGEHPPPLKEVILDLDKHTAMDTEEFPACMSSVVRSGVARAHRLCGDTIVGTGRARIEIEEPGASPSTIAVSLTIFNGGTNSRLPELLFQFGDGVHTSTLPIAVARARAVMNGRYGRRMVIEFPRIAEGYGSIVNFGFGLRRRAPGGNALGIVRAACPDRHLDFRVTGIFSDGSRISGTSVRACSAAS